MLAEPGVCLGDELPVEAPHALPALVSSDQQDRPSLLVEGVGDPPSTIIGGKPERLTSAVRARNSSANAS
jgi:hypothetical protein